MLFAFVVAFSFSFAITFEAFVRFLAFSFWLDFEEELSFDFFFLLLSVFGVLILRVLDFENWLFGQQKKS